MHPQVFLVDRGGLPPSTQNPGPVPCWSFPPARVKSKSRSCEGACVTTVVMLMMLLVLAALGLGAYQIQGLKSELQLLKQELNTQNKSPPLQKQVALRESNMDGKEIKVAAHLTVRIEKQTPPGTLRWEPSHGRAFTDGVSYLNGGIRINKTGQYFVYSRVEYVAKYCPSTESLVHTVFKRDTRPIPIVLLEGHREGNCPRQNSGFWSTSSYVGAVLQLNRLDQVFVNVSHPALLSHHHNGNFFGLFKI